MLRTETQKHIIFSLQAQGAPAPPRPGGGKPNKTAPAKHVAVKNVLGRESEVRNSKSAHVLHRPVIFVSSKINTVMTSYIRSKIYTTSSFILVTDQIQNCIKLWFLQRLEDLYTLGKVLGSGQFGVTKECTDKRTGEKLACKTIPKTKIKCAQPRFRSILVFTKLIFLVDAYTSALRRQPRG